MNDEATLTLKLEGDEPANMPIDRPTQPQINLPVSDSRSPIPNPGVTSASPGSSSPESKSQVTVIVTREAVQQAQTNPNPDPFERVARDKPINVQNNVQPANVVVVQPVKDPFAVQVTGPAYDEAQFRFEQKMRRELEVVQRAREQELSQVSTEPDAPVTDEHRGLKDKYYYALQEAYERLQGELDTESLAQRHRRINIRKEIDRLNELTAEQAAQDYANKERAGKREAEEEAKRRAAATASGAMPPNQPPGRMIGGEWWPDEPKNPLEEQNRGPVTEHDIPFVEALFDEKKERRRLNEQIAEREREKLRAELRSQVDPPEVKPLHDESEYRKRINAEIALREQNKRLDELRKEIDPEYRKQLDQQDAQQNAMLMAMGGAAIGGRPGQLMGSAAQFMNPKAMEGISSLLSGAGGAAELTAAAGPIGVIIAAVQQRLSDMGESNRAMASGFAGTGKDVLSMDPDKALNRMVAGFDKVADSAVAVSPILGTITPAAKEFVHGVLDMRAVIQSTSERLGEYNGNLASVLAQQDNANFQREMRRAQTFGNDFARLTEQRIGIDDKIGELTDKFMPLFIKWSEGVMLILESLLSATNRGIDIAPEVMRHAFVNGLTVLSPVLGVFGDEIWERFIAWWNNQRDEEDDNLTSLDAMTNLIARFGVGLFGHPGVGGVPALVQNPNGGGLPRFGMQ